MEWEDCVYEEEVPYELELSLESSPSSFLQTGEEIAGILEEDEAEDTEESNSSEYKSHELELQELEKSAGVSESLEEGDEGQEIIELDHVEIVEIDESQLEISGTTTSEDEEEDTTALEVSLTTTEDEEDPIEVGLITTEEEDEEDEIESFDDVDEFVDDGFGLFEVEVPGEFSESKNVQQTGFEEGIIDEKETTNEQDEDIEEISDAESVPGVENEWVSTNWQNGVYSVDGAYAYNKSYLEDVDGYEQSGYSSEEDEREYNFNCQMPKNFTSCRYYHSDGEDSESECDDRMPIKQHLRKGLSEYQIMRTVRGKLDRRYLKRMYNNGIESHNDDDVENGSSEALKGNPRKLPRSNAIESSFVQSVPVRQPESIVRDRIVRDHIKVYRKWLGTLGEDWDDIYAKKRQIINEISLSMKQDKDKKVKENNDAIDEVDPQKVVPVYANNFSGSLGSTASSVGSETDQDYLPTTDEEESECEVLPGTVATWIVPDSRSPSPVETYEVDEPEFIGSPIVQEPPVKKRKQKHEHIPKPDIDGKIYPKPAFSYSCLIAMALKNSRNGSLPVSEIYKFMCDHFPYFKTAPSGWKNSVRHNLSLNKCFEKIEKPGNSARKGCLWALNPAKIHKMDEEVQKWSRKDPMAIRRAMSDPENLELIERGELKRDYSGHGASDEDEEEDFSEPATPLTPAQMQARRSRTNSSDSSAGDTLVTSTNTAATISQVHAALHRPVEQKIHIKKEDNTALDFGTITSVQGNYLCHSANGTGTYTLSFATSLGSTTTPIIIRRANPVK